MSVKEFKNNVQIYKLFFVDLTNQLEILVLLN